MGTPAATPRGDHQAAVVDERPRGGGFAAATWRRRGRRWETDLVVGDGEELRPLPEPNDLAGRGWGPWVVRWTGTVPPPR